MPTTFIRSGSAVERSAPRPARQRIGLLDEALALWTDDAYAGVERAPFVDHEIVRLSELREQSIDRRFELLVDAGRRSRAFVDRARTRRGGKPLSRTRTSRPRSQQRSLYHCGRQADALAVIASTRHVLLEQLRARPRSRDWLTSNSRFSDMRWWTRRSHVERRNERGQITSQDCTRQQALLAAGADDALPIAREAVQLCRDHGDREDLPRALLIAAQSMAHDGRRRPGVRSSTRCSAIARATSERRSAGADGAREVRSRRRRGSSRRADRTRRTTRHTSRCGAAYESSCCVRRPRS